MRLTVISQPESEPISVAEAGLAMWEYHNDDDTNSRITSLITAGREAAEAFLNKSVAEKTLKASYDTIQCSVKLPEGPVSTVTSIVINGADGGATDVTAQYGVSGDRVILTGSLPAVSPRSYDCFEITYTTNDDCPAAIKEAIKLYVKSVYDDAPYAEWYPAFERIMWPWRTVPV